MSGSKLAAVICDDEPKNRQDLIDRIEGRWEDILDEEFVKKVSLVSLTGCDALWPPTGAT